MSVSEKINTSFNKETSKEQEVPQSDSLREALLSASEQTGGYVRIPRNTVLIEANRETIAPELFNDIFPGVAAEVSRDHMPAFPSSVHEQGYGKIGMSTSMASLDRNVREDIGKDELSSNITLLYDGNHEEVEGEAQLPSAVLVHEELSNEQITELRGRLPGDVPLLDAKTNQLLDEVGAAEREKSRKHVRTLRNLGKLAFYDLDLEIEKSTQKNAQERMEQEARIAEGMDMFFRQPSMENRDTHSAEEYTSTHVPVYEDDGFEEFDETNEFEESYYDEPIEVYPESEEVKTHRQAEEATSEAEDALREYAENTAAALREREQKTSEAEEIVDNAAIEKYGRPVAELTDQEKKSLRRAAAKKYHPDYAAQKDSVDRDKYEAFEQILK